MTSLQAATLAPSGGVVAGCCVSGGLGVALPCASAKRSRLLPEVFDDCSSASCRLSPRVLVVLGHVEKLDTPCCPQAWHHLHVIVSAL